MNTREQELWNKVFVAKEETEQRDAVLSYVKYMTQEAQQYPSAKPGSKMNIAIGISSCIAQQDWVKQESEPLLEAILGLAAQLEIHPEDKCGWDELFELVARLK